MEHVSWDQHMYTILPCWINSTKNNCQYQFRIMIYRDNLWCFVQYKPVVSEPKSKKFFTRVCLEHEKFCLSIWCFKGKKNIILALSESQCAKYEDEYFGTESFYASFLLQMLKQLFHPRNFNRRGSKIHVTMYFYSVFMVLAFLWLKTLVKIKIAHVFFVVNIFTCIC